MKRFLLILLLFADSLLLKSQDCRINIQITGLGNSRLYFGEYLGSKQYILDTITLDKAGHAVLVHSTALNEGMYFLVLPGNSYFDLLLGECKELSLVTRDADIIGNMQITGCQGSAIYLDYQKKSLILQQQYNSLQERQKSGTSDSVAQINSRIKTTGKQLVAVRERYIAENPGSFMASILRLQRESGYGLGLQQPRSAQEFKDQFSNIVRHYLDSIDFADARLMRSSYLTERLSTYFGKLLDKQPDTIIRAIDLIMNRSTSCNFCTDMLRQWLLEYYNNATFPGSDKVYVTIADTYFLEKRSLPYSISLEESLRKKTDKMRATLWGSIPPDAGVSYPDGRLMHLADSRSPITILFFYDLDCLSCRYAITRLKLLSSHYATDQLSIFAIYMGEQRDAWLLFAKENGLPWLHGFNPLLRNTINEQYNLDFLPKIFLLDRDKRIIASAITIEEAEKFMARKYSYNTGK